MRKSILFALGLALPLGIQAEDTLLKLDAEQIQHLAIKTSAPQTSQTIPLLSAYGQIQAATNREQIVTSALPGLLVELNANVGDQVKKGQILARINSRELLGLQQNYLSTLNDLNLTQQQYRRDQKLIEDGVIAEHRWQETQSQQRNKSIASDEARQLLTLAGFSDSDIKQIAKTQRLLPQLPVRAPMNGVITERLANLGARLDSEMALYRLADLSQLWLEIRVPQEQAHLIQVGDKVEISNSTSSAVVKVIGQQVQAEAQTLAVRALIEQPGTDLKPGQSRNVQITRPSKDTLFKVPSNAVVQNGNQAYVFIQSNQGFKVSPVQIVGRLEQSVLISGALKPADAIVEQGAAALKAQWLSDGKEE